MPALPNAIHHSNRGQGPKRPAENQACRERFEGKAALRVAEA